MNPGPVEPGAAPTGERRTALALGALALTLYTWPALPTMATRLFGHPFSEVDNHLWMSWFGGRAGAPLRNLPDGFDLPLMDPVNLLWWMPGAALGPVFAYNLAVFGNLALAALGGWVLARELTGSRAAAIVGMVATAFSPFLGGMIEFGMSEAWPVGWLALHAACLLRYSRTGSLRDAGGAAATLAAFLLSGWYHAAFALVAELGLGLWILARRPRLATVGVILAQGLVAVLPILPRLLETRAKASIWAPRLSGLTRPQTYTDWDGNPRFGTDLVNLLLPRLDEIPTARTVYVGVVVVALAVLALRRRAGWALWAIAAPLWILALGHWLRVGGVPVPGMGPLPAGWLVGSFEAARGISHWYRAAGPATVFAGAAAAVGTAALLEHVRSPVRWGVVLAGLVLVDAIALAPTPWPRATYAPDPPAALLDLPREGGLLQLPFDEGEGLDDIASRRVYDQWQIFHGRPIAEHYEGRDALLYRNATVAGWQRSCAGLAPLLPAVRTPREDLQVLVDLGVTYVVVHPPYAKSGCAAVVGRRLGEPVVRSARAVVWDLATAPDLVVEAR
ncbi:MAG: hypothetical protein Q8P41_17560 [Pseudomonadota bacterium]|nr:hypothetical protein [Pseudomonadota bacterium]